jgi:hypothetical protein
VTDPKVMKMILRTSPMVWGASPAAIFVCKDLTRGGLDELRARTPWASRPAPWEGSTERRPSRSWTSPITSGRCC